MIKKPAAVMLAAAMAVLSGISAAAVQTSITGITTDKGIIYSQYRRDRMILNGYDESGTLKVSKLFEAGDEGIIIPSELAKYKLRAVFPDGIYDVEIEQGPSATSAPLPTQEPSATQTPQAAQTPAPAGNRAWPEIYERQADAVEAIAVVDAVSYGENENSEEYYYVSALYQGSETDFEIKGTVTVSEASDEFQYMLGQNMTALEKGDVICVTANLSGEINKVGFVYRPLDKNIVTNGNNYGNSFEKLISQNGGVAGRNGWTVMKYGESGRNKNQLAFGAVSDRYGKSLTLLGADGDENKALDLSLEEDTIVYVCDMSSRRELSVKGISGIEKSSIPKSAKDEDGIVTYSDDYKMNYALARVVNGTVTDIVIYKNYNR